MEAINCFRSIPTPNEWLARVVIERGISGNSLAKMIGQSAPQINRWINGKEKIPRHHLAEIAIQVGIPGEFEYVNQLKNCEQLTAQLERQVIKLAKLINANSEDLQKALLQQVEELAIKEADLMYLGSLTNFIARFVIDAIFAVRLMIEMLEVDFIEPMITQGNIARHLRYPINHMIGLLLTLTRKLVSESADDDLLRESRSNMLNNLRRIIEETNPSSQANRFIRMHATYLLSRYGNPGDHGYVEALIHNENVSLDPLTKRLGFMGLILGRDHLDSTEHFLYELKRDEGLAEADILFDAVHYGDVNLNISQDMPRNITHFSNTIFHILRHLKDSEAYESILPTEVYKLLRLLDRIGIEPFLNAFILSSLRDVLKSDTILFQRQYQPEQNQLEKQFSHLLDIGVQQGLIDEG